jgi:DNA-binding response OmpR family regulator
MPWDDFARVGASRPCGPAAHGVSIGAPAFPAALGAALTQAALHLDEVSDPTAPGHTLLSRKPDIVIATAAALGPDPERVVREALGPRSTAPVVLVTAARAAAETAPANTPFAEVLGAGQDALGYFLMLRATLRRKRPQAITDVLTCGCLSLDQERFALSLAGREAPLNKLEFCVLGAMLDAPRMVWSKVFLNRVVFGPVDVKPGRQFDTYMSRVRRSLRERMGVDPIVAEHRMGYALSPAVLGIPGIAAS